MWIVRKYSKELALSHLAHSEIQTNQKSLLRLRLGRLTQLPTNDLGGENIENSAPIKIKDLVQCYVLSIIATLSYFGKSKHWFTGGRDKKKKVLLKSILPSTVCTLLALTCGSASDPLLNMLAGNLLMYCEIAEISQVLFFLLMELTAFCNAVSTFLPACLIHSVPKSAKFSNLQHLSVMSEISFTTVKKGGGQ